MRKVLARSRKEVGKCQSRDTGGTGTSAAPSANSRNWTDRFGT
nr:MAG TPA: hypothetical protein [Caudoviricetes sp.]DAZ70597.1 MAG TPA: hypothetical protein [Caudoviricetes sp.]